MTEKIWTLEQVKKLYDLKMRYTIPMEVMKEIERLVEALNQHYGFERDIENGDGGYVVLLLPEDDSADMDSLYLELMEEYCLCIDTAEMEKIFCRHEKWKWHSDLYLTTKDYGIMVLYPKERFS